MKQDNRTAVSHHLLSRMNLVMSCAVMLFALAFAHDASALSLDPVLTAVTSVVKPGKADDTRAVRQNQQSDAKSTAPAGAPQAAKQSPASSTSAPAAPLVTPPEVVVTAPLAELPTIDASDIAAPPVQVGQLASGVRLASVPIAPVAQPPRSDSAPLQVSSQGWRIFDVAWYWWVAGAAGLFYGLRSARLRHRGRFTAATSR